MGKINKQWHEAHPMPKNATTEQRIAWHLEHQQHCSCRDIPAKLKEEIKKAPSLPSPAASNDL